MNFQNEYLGCPTQPTRQELELERLSLEFSIAEAELPGSVDRPYISRELDQRFKVQASRFGVPTRDWVYAKQAARHRGQDSWAPRLRVLNELLK